MKSTGKLNKATVTQPPVEMYRVVQLLPCVFIFAFFFAYYFSLIVTTLLLFSSLFFFFFSFFLFLGRLIFQKEDPVLILLEVK